MAEVEPAPGGRAAMAPVVILGAAPLFTELLATALKRHGVDASGSETPLHRLPPGSILLVAATGGDEQELSARVATLRADAPQAHVVLLVGRADGGASALVRAAGAMGWVSRDDSVHDVVSTLREASLAVPTRRRADPPAAVRERAEGAPSLTAREMEVLELVAGGDSDDAVAERLRISVHTVRTHLTSARSKLGVPSRFAAVAACRRAGLLQPVSAVPDAAAT